MINQINISKSKQTKKLVFKQWIIERIFYYLVEGMFIIALPFLASLEFYSDFSKNEPIGISLGLLLLSLIFSSLLLYSVLNLYGLARIRGLSRGQNSALIKKIAEKNNWKIYSSNQEMTIILLHWSESSGFDWGKQITIIYERTDILANCMSFGINSDASPFHWFANKRKINQLMVEFENELKNALQQRL